MLWIPILITILGLIYIISPIDLIPDVIPIIGWSDDALVGIIIALTWGIYLLWPLIAGIFKGLLGIITILGVIGGWLSNPIVLTLVIILVGLMIYLFVEERNKKK